MYTIVDSITFRTDAVFCTLFLSPMCWFGDNCALSKLDSNDHVSSNSLGTRPVSLNTVQHYIRIAFPSFWDSSTVNAFKIIKKYDSTSYIGMGHIQNGILYTRYRGSSAIIRVEWCKMLANKNPLLFYCQNYFESSANISQIWENWMQKFQFCSFFLTRNSKTTGCIQMLYIQNDCSTIGDVSFPWLESYDTNTHCGRFPMHHFVPISCIAQEL